MKSPISPRKNKYFSRLIDKHPKFFDFVKKYKLAIVLTVGIILISSLVYFIAVSNKTNSRKSEQNKGKKILDGSSLKVGDYIQFGSYQVEREGYSPLLWVVINNNSHYTGDVNPDIGHLTLLTADIIDLRGFDAIEPKNTNDIRRGFGNSRYRTSNIRQWLNSDEDSGKWWKAQNLDDANNNADAPPSDGGFPVYGGLGYDDKDGFLKGFLEEEKQAILETKITIGKNTVTEGGGQETVTDKVFLLSLTETGFEGLGGAVEGKPFSLFKDDPSWLVATISKECAASSKSSDKPSANKKWSWWLRSPSTGFPASVYIISNTGGALYSPASMPEGSIGVRPALNLKKSYIFSGTGTREDPFRISAESDDLITESSETAKNDETIVAVDKEKVALSEGDKILKDICQNVIADYPEGDITLGGIVAWEDSDETFYIRSSPDSSSWGADNPAKDGYKLVDIGFLDSNTLGFTLLNSNQKYKIGMMNIEFENYGTVFKGSKSSIKYENKGEVLDVSYISKEDFVILYKDNKKILLKHKDILLYQTDYSSSGSYKLGKSPNSAYVYMIFGNDLLIFDLSKNIKIGDIKSVSSAVWIGNLNILYSGRDTVILYNLKNKTSTHIEAIKSGELGFCPKNDGTIIYNKNSEAHAISCKSFVELNSASNTFFEALADSNTAISTKYKPDGSVEETGYWRFIASGWGLHLSDGMYYHNNKPVLATLWSNY